MGNIRPLPPYLGAMCTYSALPSTKPHWLNPLQAWKDFLQWERFDPPYLGAVCT